MGGVKSSLSDAFFSSDSVRTVRFENLSIDVIHGSRNSYENYKSILDQTMLAKRMILNIETMSEIISDEMSKRTHYF